MTVFNWASFSFGKSGGYCSHVSFFLKSAAPGKCWLRNVVSSSSPFISKQSPPTCCRISLKRVTKLIFCFFAGLLKGFGKGVVLALFSRMACSILSLSIFTSFPLSGSFIPLFERLFGDLRQFPLFSPHIEPIVNQHAGKVFNAPPGHLS